MKRNRADLKATRFLFMYTCKEIEIIRFAIINKFFALVNNNHNVKNAFSF
jgi:hypothetical protein